MRGDAMAAEAVRCGGILKDKGADLISIGKHMQNSLPALPSS
jgi:hypothetical protein